MSRLRFRLPGRSRPLGEWLARLLPELSRADRRRLIESGQVRIDGEVAGRRSGRCPPGARVEIEAAALAELDRTPAESAASCETATVWEAWVDPSPYRAGRLSSDAGPAIEFEQSGAEGGLLRLRLVAEEPVAGVLVCEQLARAGMPVAGDLERGGLGLSGGPRLAVVGAGEGAARLDGSEEPAWRGDATETDWDDASASDGEPGTLDEAKPRLVVSDQTTRIVDGGHPWIRPDDASDPVSRFAPGALVSVDSRGGRRLGWAHVEGEGPIAARIWERGAVPLQDAPSVDARVARALARRRALLASSGEALTDAHRLVHGEGDALPGLYVDRLGPLLRVLVRGRSSDGFREELLEGLARQLPVTPEGQPWSVLEVLHLRTPGTVELERVRWRAGGLRALRDAGAMVDEHGLVVSERGLRFFVDPGWHAPRRSRPGFGLFVDQRENRARLAAIAAQREGEWLNLFAHTGAFSVALLAAGASRVTSVDLSGPYLARLERNLALNLDRGVDPARHQSVRGDARRFLENLDPDTRFSGIVVDPPTAAAAGRRYWSVEHTLEPMLRAAVDRLESGGTLLVTQNRVGPPIGLDRLLERVARRAHRSLEALEPAPAGSDHPSLPAFPEGDPFEGWLARLR